MLMRASWPWAAVHRVRALAGIALAVPCGCHAPERSFAGSLTVSPSPYSARSRTCNVQLELPLEPVEYPPRIALSTDGERAAIAEAFRERTGVRWHQVYVSETGTVQHATLRATAIDPGEPPAGVPVPDRPVERVQRFWSELIEHHGEAFGLPEAPEFGHCPPDAGFAITVNQGGHPRGTISVSWLGEAGQSSATLRTDLVPPELLALNELDGVDPPQVGNLRARLEITLPSPHPCDCLPGDCSACVANTQAHARLQQEVEAAVGTALVWGQPLHVETVDVAPEHVRWEALICAITELGPHGRETHALYRLARPRLDFGPEAEDALLPPALVPHLGHVKWRIRWVEEPVIYDTVTGSPFPVRVVASLFGRRAYRCERL